jgi:hypothetical protein
MTTLANFDIASDIKVEFFLPDAEGNLFILGVSNLGSDDLLAGANQFIIGVSELGGTDLLWGGDDIAFTWQGFECSVAEVELSLGGGVRDSFYFQPEPAQANIRMQNLLFDPTTNPAMRPGVPVRVRLERDDFSRVLFNGLVDKIDVSYTLLNNNLMSITALDTFKQFVNSRLELLDTADPIEFPEGYATPYEVIEILADQFGTAMNEQSEETAGKIPGTTLENFIPNTALYDAIKVGLGLFWVDPETQEFVFKPRPLPSESGDPYVVGNNHGEPNHLCMSDISVTSELDAVYNSLQVTLQSDDEVSVIKTSQDSIDLFGIIALDETVNTTDVTELERWANAVFTQTTTKLVQSVETPAVNRLGTLTEAAFFLPGEPLGVKYQTDRLNINDRYTITKVSHSIDVDGWFTTLELWKEF